MHAVAATPTGHLNSRGAVDAPVPTGATIVLATRSSTVIISFVTESLDGTEEKGKPSVIS